MSDLGLYKNSKSCFLLTFSLALLVPCFTTPGTIDAEPEVVLTHFAGRALNTGGDATLLLPLDGTIIGL